MLLSLLFKSSKLTFFSHLKKLLLDLKIRIVGLNFYFNATSKGNLYILGLHVERGSGYVNITHSMISDNYVDGVNITYGGGSQNI